MLVFNFKRILMALIFSVIFHGVLIASIMYGVNRFHSQEQGVGGFESGAGLNITLGDIQRVDEAASVSNNTPIKKIKAHEMTSQALVSSQASVEKFSDSPSQELQSSQVQRQNGEQLSGETEKNHNGNTKGEQQHYYAEVMAILNAHKRYHKLARERGLQGTVVLRFSISSKGDLLKHEVVKSSGELLLDRSAEQMLLNSVPFPPFPEIFTEESIVIELPVEYSLNEHP